MDAEKINIRKILQVDNQRLGKIVRNTLAEFGCALRGTAFADPETDFLFEQYSDDRTVYYVAEMNGEIAGGSGIGQLHGFTDTCELQKMYLIPEARGKGIAKKLMDLCISFAREKGYKKIYLESMPQLHKAISIYSKYGFITLDKPILQTGHFTCNVWMIKEL